MPVSNTGMFLSIGVAIATSNRLPSIGGFMRFLLLMVAGFPLSAAEAEVDFREPVLEFDLSDAMSEGDFHLSPDGKTALVPASRPEMRVWTPLAWFWPEWTAPFVLGAMIGALLRLRRRWRLPNAFGEEQCGRCGYLLRGLTAERCPECGSHLTPANRVVGKSRTGMVVRHLAFVVGLPVLYGIGLCVGRFDGPECGPYSATLHRWLDKAGLLDRMNHHDGMRPTLEPNGQQFATVILVFDLNDGSLVRTVRLDRNASDRPFFGPVGFRSFSQFLPFLATAISDDGESCFVSDESGLKQYAMADGALIRRFSAPVDSYSAPENSDIELGRDGRTVYIGFKNYFGSELFGIWEAWDIVTDRPAAAIEPEPDRPMHTWSIDHWQRRGLPIPDDGGVGWGMAVTPDGRWFFSCFGPFGPDGELGWTIGDGYAVYDVRQGEWAPHIPYRPGLTPMSLRVSRDGRWLVTATAVGPDTTRYRKYDLSRLPSREP